MPDKDVMLQIKALNEQLGHRALDAEAKAAAEGSPDASWPLREALAELSGDWRMLADLYERAKLKGAKTAYVEPLRHAAVELDKVIKQLEQPRRAPLGQLQGEPDRTVQDPCDMVMKPHAPHAWTHPDGNIGVLHCPGVGRTREQVERNAGLDEPRHRFVPYPNGTACVVDVVRDGAVQECGRYASHPAHRLDGPVERPGLDALIAEASSEGTALGVTDEQRADSEKIMGDLRDHIASSYLALDFPGQASGDEVAAYLRGEVDDIPGAPPLAPSTVHDMTETEVALAANPELTERIENALTDPSSLVYRDRPQRAGSPDEWAMSSAKETLATVTTDPAIPPVPLLGQPGDAGAGYSPAYAPPGGVPLTYAELLTPVPYASLPPHLSHSQIETIGDCPTKYRAQRLDSVPREGGPIVEIPQWALIGGKAFHAAVEQIERETQQPSAGWQADDLWRYHFDAEVQKVEASQPVPRSRWRASKQGAEGETWWNANGPEMLRRYLAARPDEPTASFAIGPNSPSEPAIELERTVEVPTAYGPIEYRVILDHVTVRIPDGSPSDNPDVTLVIRDYKAGASMPSDTAQLGEYANVLRLLGVPPQVKIVGTFFNARKGTWTPEVDLDKAWPTEWFVYHVTAGQAQRLALTQGPTPARPSSFCGGCSVRWACPIKNGAGR